MRRIHFLILLLTLSACLPAPTVEPTSTGSAPYLIIAEENPYAPKPEDLSLQIAGVTITSVNLSERFEFTPPRVLVNFLGYMPGVCNELRINVKPPDENYRVFIDVYSLTDSAFVCEGVFQQFEASIMLGTYSSGSYTIWVNDEPAGDFSAY